MMDIYEEVIGRVTDHPKTATDIMNELYPDMPEYDRHYRYACVYKALASAGKYRLIESKLVSEDGHGRVRYWYIHGTAVIGDNRPASKRIIEFCKDDWKSTRSITKELYGECSKVNRARAYRHLTRMQKKGIVESRPLPRCTHLQWRVVVA